MNEKKDISMETKEEGLQEQILAERFSLCRERISQIGEEELAEEAFRDYFVNTAKQIELFVQEYFNVAEDGLRKPVSGNCRRITAGFIRMSFLKIMEKLCEPCFCSGGPGKGIRAGSVFSGGRAKKPYRLCL